MLVRCSGGIEETLFYYAFPREHWRLHEPTIPGTYSARSATQERGRGSVSRWQISTDVAAATAAPCGRHEVGHTALSGYEPPSGSERSSVNAPRKNFRLPCGGAEHRNHRPTPQQMCEKFWTLPLSSPGILPLSEFPIATYRRGPRR